MKKIITAILIAAMLLTAAVAMADTTAGSTAGSTAAAVTTIGYGSRDAAGETKVSDMQQKLIDYGYLNGKADGIFGKRTYAALREFQLANSLSDSGVYDAATQTKLSDANAVRRSSYVENKYYDYYSPDTPRRVTNSTVKSTSSSKSTSAAKSTASGTVRYYDTPNTPDYNTPNTPDYNTPNTPDYNTPNTPDRNTPNSPDRNT